MDEVFSHPFRSCIESFYDSPFRNVMLENEGFEYHPPNLSVGTLKGRLFLIVNASPIWITIPFFEQYPIIHKGIVPSSRVGSIEGLLHQGKYFGIFDTILLLKKVVDKNPPYVRFDKDDRCIEGEGANCGGSCPTNSRKGH